MIGRKALHPQTTYSEFTLTTSLLSERPFAKTKPAIICNATGYNFYNLIGR